MAESNENYSPEELAEIAVADRLAADIKYLMSNDQFKRVIIGRYINDTALDVGVAFTGSKEDIDKLTSVTNLTDFLTVNS